MPGSNYPPPFQRIPQPGQGDDELPGMVVVPELPAVQSKGVWGFVVGGLASVYTILSFTGVVPPGLEGPIVALLGNLLGLVGVKTEGPVTSILPKR